MSARKTQAPKMEGADDTGRRTERMKCGVCKRNIREKPMLLVWVTIWPVANFIAPDNFYSFNETPCHRCCLKLRLSSPQYGAPRISYSYYCEICHRQKPNITLVLGYPRQPGLFYIRQGIENHYHARCLIPILKLHEWLPFMKLAGQID